MNGSAACGGTCTSSYDASSGTLSWSLDVPAHSSGTVSFAVTVNSDTADGTVIDNVGYIATGQKKVPSNAVDYGTGAIYRRVPARVQAARDNEWFTMTVVAHGNHLATWVNGVQQVDWTDNRPADDNPRKGYRAAAGAISIQGHDRTTDLSFRNIRIESMPKAAK